MRTDQLTLWSKEQTPISATIRRLKQNLCGGDRKQFDLTEAKTPNTSSVPLQDHLSLLS